MTDSLETDLRAQLRHQAEQVSPDVEHAEAVIERRLAEGDALLGRAIEHPARPRRRVLAAAAAVAVVGLVAGALQLTEDSDQQVDTGPVATEPEGSATTAEPAPSFVETSLSVRPLLVMGPCELVSGLPGPSSEPGFPEGPICFDLGEGAENLTVVSAEARPDPAGLWGVVVELTEGSQAEVAAVIARCLARPDDCPAARVALVLDGEVLSSPTVIADISLEDGIVVSGGMSEAAAQTLAARILAGPGDTDDAGATCPRAPSIPVYIGSFPDLEGRLTFDEIEWLTGARADAAYEAETGETDGAPNDHFITNQSTEQRSANVAPDAIVQLVRLAEDGDADLGPGTVAELPGYLAAGSPTDVYWLRFEGDTIVQICEQYRP